MAILAGRDGVAGVRGLEGSRRIRPDPGRPGQRPGSDVAGGSERPGADTEYRAVFKTPADEGINGDTSPTVLVDVVVACTTTVTADGAIAVPCA